MEQNLLHH